MPLLLDNDYAKLEERGIDYVEEDTQRFLVLRDFILPEGIYQEEVCDVLVIIPSNYNQAGIDMIWTFPHLTRLDHQSIPRMNKPGGGDNRRFNGNEFCRWSRHWTREPERWRPGKDNIETILARIIWVFSNPEAKK